MYSDKNSAKRTQFLFAWAVAYCSVRHERMGEHRPLNSWECVIDENGGGPGVRLRKRPPEEGLGSRGDDWRGIASTGNSKTKPISRVA
jgi:hypothetical protein